MKIIEFFDLDNPLGAVDDVIGGVGKLFTGKAKDNRTKQIYNKKQQNADNAKWCANPKNKKNINYKKICK